MLAVMKNKLAPKLAAHPALCLIALAASAAVAQTSEPQSLPMVVVSATRHAMALVDAPAAMTVVTREQIADRGADNLFEALRGETGLSFIGRTISGRRNISLRGMDGRHTLFLVDGKRIGASDGVVGHSDFQYDWVAVEEIERIEVVRGPMSVLYGSEALGGVVNVIARESGDRWSLRAMTEGSWADGGRDGDGHRAAASVSGPLSDQWRLAVTASNTMRQAVASADPRISDLEGREKQDGALRLAWRPTAGHQLDLEQRVGHEDRWAGVRERGGARRFHDSLHDIDRAHTSLGWAADWGGDWQASSLLRAYGSRVEVNNTRTQGVAALRPQTLDDRVFEGQGSVRPAAGRVFTSGFEWRDEKLANAGLTGGGGEATHQALFGQAELDVAPNFALTLGARRDWHERFGAEWSPRAYGVWKPAGHWVVKAGLGHGYKAPTLKQISPDYREDEGPYTYFGNATLRPESNDAGEAGIGWDTAGLGIQAMVFHNRVKNLIVPRLFATVSGRGQYVFENIDRARLQGLELESRAVLPLGFQAGANYTYLDAIDGTGQRLEKRPRHLLGVQLDWVGGPWRAGVRATHHRDQVTAPTVVGQPYQPLPNLTRVSAQVTRALGPNLEASLGVDNLTQLRLADESPLFTWAEAPRTWRLALRGQW